MLNRARHKAGGARDEWEAMSVGLLARHRHYGLPLHAEKGKPSARDQLGGSVVGRMVMQQELSRVQGDVAAEYLKVIVAYRRAIGAPPLPGAIRLGAVSGRGAGEPENVEVTHGAVERYDKMMEALAECQSSIANRGRNIYAALDFMVVRDEIHAHMVGDVRVALNALARHFRIGDLG